MTETSERKQLSEVAKALNWQAPYQASLAERASALISERDALKAECDQLRAALKPFAQIANEYSDDEDDDFQLWQDAHEPASRVTLGMCRAARR